MAEWLKAHDSKSCGRFSRLGGSNPLASAKQVWLQRRVPRGGLLPPFFMPFLVVQRFRPSRSRLDVALGRIPKFRRVVSNVHVRAARLFQSP